MRFDGGGEHQYSTPKAYYRHLYHEACDLLSSELVDRFENQHISSVLALEQLLIKAANGEVYDDELDVIKNSEYKDDLDLLSCTRHLPLLQDVIKQATPCVKRVTFVHTICEAMNSNSSIKATLPSVHKILRLYLTVPVTCATSERTFSSLKYIFNYSVFAVNHDRAETEPLCSTSCT